jgi:DNA-binding CsgD family transcriptional regulator
MRDALNLETSEISDCIDKLTARQLTVVSYICQGRTDKEIAGILSISRGRVRQHVTNARKRIGADNRAQLIAVFVAWKYLLKMGRFISSVP